MTVKHFMTCDGCGKQKETVPSDPRHPEHGRPKDWRKLHVTDEKGKRSVFDICSSYCAAKAVDSTYEESDRLQLIRGG